MTLCALALVVSFLGARVFTLYFNYATRASHWHFESRWLFRFSEAIAVICMLIAVVFWFKAGKEPDESRERVPDPVGPPGAQEPRGL